ncbi:hypothetical protein M422DRAFT_63470 [Sphaerobolus stellatus SS14]|nr:hypothetical protein M422DRAFT_63470 [Sphaerobolus stellatus SS14]
MAFELPAHLPRGGIPQDRPTQVLTKVSQATNKTLNAILAASWLAELDVSIKDTKERISRRIQEDLPVFERQRDASVSIQRRLNELSSIANELEDALHNPNTGTLPALLQTLTTHATLASQAQDSDVAHRGLEHLLRLKNEISKLSKQMADGELPDASLTCSDIQGLIAQAPTPLEKADIMAGIKKRFRTLNDRVQEQLNDAYSRSVVFSSTVDGVSMAILPTTIVGAKATSIALSAILISLSADFLSTRLTTLRRDILSKIIESILVSSKGIEVTIPTDPSSPNTLSLSSSSANPLQSLRTVASFLDAHLYPYLPARQASFSLTLHIPISTAILDHLLKPSLPATIHALPSYLDILDDAVRFEEELFTPATRERPIRYWAEEVANHYEKKRREEFLQKTRTIINGREDGTTFRVVTDVRQPTPSQVVSSVPPPRQSQPQASKAIVKEKSKEEGAGWDGEEESGWEFDDDEPEEPTPQTEPEPEPEPRSPSPEPARSPPPEPVVTQPVRSASPEPDQGDDDDEGDGWGWGDDADPVDTEDPIDPVGPMDAEPPASTSQAPSAPPSKPDEETDESWASDSWSADPGSSPTQSDPEHKPKESHIVAPTPKLAKRLEKFSAKAKGLSAPNTPLPSPAVAAMQVPSRPTPPPPSPMFVQPKVLAQPQPKQMTPAVSRLPVEVPKKEEKESYLISVRAKTVLQLAEQVLREGEELSASNVFAKHAAANSTSPGQLLITTAPSVLDLYRALYPITHSFLLEKDTNICMRWSNDCTFLSKEVGDLRRKDGTIDNRWVETGERLHMLGELSFENAIVQEQETVTEILARAEGFVHVSKGDRYFECRDAVESTFQEIRDVAARWKETLTRSNYLRAIGQIVDDALYRVMDDILAIHDIPEADSERLSELCEMFTPLEDLFIYTPGHQSVIASFVPLWFKFSYLSWLIKGSMADISYLFDEGMLVDYDVNELARLVRALFAETPLREKTIAKFMQGHPAHE